MNRYLWSILLIVMGTEAAGAQIVAKPGEARPQVADKKFWLLTGATGAVGLADAAQHFKCRSDHPPVPPVYQNGQILVQGWAGCREGNPLLGSYPSPQRSLATGAGFHAVGAWAGYELKKRRKWYWWTPQAALIGLHVYGIVSTRHKWPGCVGELRCVVGGR